MIEVLLLAFVLLIGATSCQDTRKQGIEQQLSEWMGREIRFPAHPYFTVQGRDTVTCGSESPRFTILSYVDSTGCTGCKLHLPEWTKLISELDSLCPGEVSCQLYLHPKTVSEARHLLRQYGFMHPVCIDREDSLNLLNRFPTDMTFQTFLLDSDNRVLAVGNPVQNLRIRELYLRLIQGESLQQPSIPQTTVRADRQEHRFGTFDVRQEQQTVFRLANTGHHPLVVAGIDRSCDCVKVVCSPDTVPPGQTLELKVTYQAGDVIEFEESITVHSNAAGSPLRFVVSGEAR